MDDLNTDFVWGSDSDSSYGRAGTSVQKNWSLESEARSLRGQVDRLTLVSQAMWELLRDAGYSTEEALAKKIAEVDLRDGLPDGKLGSTVIKCGSCGRNTNSRRTACVWCGVEVEREHIFEG